MRDMTQIIKTVGSIAFLLSATRRIVDALEALIEDNVVVEAPINHKVEAILNGAGLIKNPVDAAEEQYIKTVEDGLSRSKVDPHLAAFAVDLMRVCPSNRQYMSVTHGPKKALYQAGATNDPWVGFRREAFLLESGEIDEVTSLVVQVQRGLVEPAVTLTASGKMRFAVRFIGANPSRFIELALPSLGAMLVNGEWSTMNNVFAQVAASSAYRAGRRVPVRIVVARRSHPIITQHTKQYAKS